MLTRRDHCNPNTFVETEALTDSREHFDLPRCGLIECVHPARQLRYRLAAAEHAELPAIELPRTMPSPEFRQAVSERLSQSMAAVPAERFGKPALITPRLGQGAFRLFVTDSYERRCAVTGERTLPILDAAHIQSYDAGGEHVPSNGIVLRTDIHRLFDLGYVTVGTKGHFEVSSRLKADFDNGRHYYNRYFSSATQVEGGAALCSRADLASRKLLSRVTPWTKHRQMP